MLNSNGSAFSPNLYIFQANASALSIRLRRPHDVIHTEGSASLTGGGGRAGADGGQVDLHKGALTADSYRTEVTGDFADLPAAAKLTDSQDDTVSPWGSNKLEVVTSVACTVNGFKATNFNSPARNAGPSLRVGQLDFRMVGRHRRQLEEELEIRFDRLSFADVSINDLALRVSVRSDVFSKFPTFASFKNEFDGNYAFRREFGHMVYRPDPKAVVWPEDKLYDRRGHCLVTVVNKIEWADPKCADPRIQINGHTVIVPGYGTVYLGEMTMMPYQRRLHMVRVDLGCPDGGDSRGGSGCPGGHEHP